MLSPFIRVESGVVIFVSVVFEPLSVSAKYSLDIFEEEELAEGGDFAKYRQLYLLRKL